MLYNFGLDIILYFGIMRLYLPFGADTMAKIENHRDAVYRNMQSGMKWTKHTPKGAPKFPFPRKSRKKPKPFKDMSADALRKKGIVALKEWVAHWNPRYDNATHAAHVMNNLNVLYRKKGYYPGEEPYWLSYKDTNRYKTSSKWKKHWEKIPNEFTPYGRNDLVVMPVAIDHWGHVLTYEISEEPGVYFLHGDCRWYDYYLYPIWRAPYITHFGEFYESDGEED